MIDFKRKEPVSNFRLNRFLYRGPNCQNLARQVLWFLIVTVTVAGQTCIIKGKFIPYDSMYPVHLSATL